MGEEYVDYYSALEYKWADVDKLIRRELHGLLKKYCLNEAYLTDEDVGLKVEGKDLLKREPWKLSPTKYHHDKELIDWIYFGELQPHIVKKGVYGLLVSLEGRKFTLMHGVFDRGTAKGQLLHLREVGRTIDASPNIELEEGQFKFHPQNDLTWELINGFHKTRHPDESFEKKYFQDKSPEFSLTYQDANKGGVYSIPKDNQHISLNVSFE